MGLTHGNVIFDILEPPAFKKYSIYWVFQAFFCSTFFYMYFAIQPRPALTAVEEETPTLYELVLMQGSYLIMGEIPLLLSVCPLTGKQPQEQRLPDISNKPLDGTNVI